MGEGAVDELSAALYVEDRDVRTGAALALLRINDRGRQKVVHVLQTGGTFTRLSMANAMITENYKPELTIPILAEELMDPDDWLVRNQASKALSQLSPKSVSAVPALVELLRHPEAEVRRRAAFAMVRIGPGAKAATPALVEALKDQDPRVREGAAYALGTIGPDASPSAPALEVASQDADPKVRYRAAQALKLVTAQRS
jgi:HEAT repeat protein